MLKLDLLRLCQTKSASDVREGLLREDDRRGSHRANLADKLNVFDCFRKELQTTAILFEKTQARAIDLAVDQQTQQALMTEAGSERQLALGYVKSGFSVTESLIVKASDVFKRRVTHRGVVAVDVESSHSLICGFCGDDLRAGIAHFIDSAIAVAGLKFDCSHRVL